MFGDVVDPSVKMGNRQGASVLMTVLLEAVLVGAFIIIPLMATDILPAPPDMMGAFVTAPPPPPPPSAPQKPVEIVNPDAAPIEAPEEIIPEPPEVPTDTSFETVGVVGGVPGGVPGGVIGGLPQAPPPAPPPAPPAPVRVGGNIQAPKKIKDVKPVYPSIAQSARVSGIVIIEALIDVSGKVQSARVIRSVALLDDAALDAVRQWEFTPTLLNGKPTPIIMSVTVNFQLS
jgi:protein TonB